MKRERVERTLRHEATDIVPHNIELTSGELVRVADHIGIPKEDFFEWAGNHIEKANCNGGGGYVATGHFRDEFGVVWNRAGLDKDIGVVDQPLLKEADLSGYTFPEPEAAAIQNAIEAMIGGGRDSFKFAKIGLAYFERAWSLRGMENLLMDFLMEPSFVQQLLERIVEYNLKIIDIALAYKVDGFYFGDDYGQQTGLIMSPETWRELIKPGLAEMFKRVKSAGKVVALHSCGNIGDILSDLVDIGLDIYQTVQPEVYDFRELKTRYGNRLVFWGGISTQRLLPFASPSALKDAVREIVSVLAKGGGYIAAPTHQVPPDVPPENIIALVEFFAAQAGSMP